MVYKILNFIDLEEFLVSGMIEDYCLGQLSSDDMRLVAQLAEQHDEIKMAIESYELTLVKYAKDWFGQGFKEE